MIDLNTINKGFGLMADEYDAIQHTNIPVKIMRDKFYETVLSLVKPPADMLELNCGSGIDAIYLAEKGFNVLATDISDKMLQNASAKKLLFEQPPKKLSFRKMNLLDAENLEANSYDVVISNSGGLNCIDNPGLVNSSLRKIIRPGGYFIAVVMPQFSLWEFLLLLKGEFKRAFRRIKPNGILANVGSEQIFVNYYSPKKFYTHFRKDFKMISTKALRILAPPPPAENWYNKYPKLSSILDKADNAIEGFYPASLCCDFYILVLQKRF